MTELEDLKPKEYNFRYQYIKGKIAEHIIEQLFHGLGYEVSRYGMESTVPKVLHYIKENRKTSESLFIQNMPDLIVYIPETKRIHFVEVKYRSDGKFTEEDINEHYPYQETFIVLVSKESIKCIKVNELSKDNHINIKSLHHIYDRTEFCITNKHIVNGHIELARKFYKDLDGMFNSSLLSNCQIQ